MPFEREYSLGDELTQYEREHSFLLVTHADGTTSTHFPDRSTGQFNVELQEEDTYTLFNKIEDHSLTFVSKDDSLRFADAFYNEEQSTREEEARKKENRTLTYHEKSPYSFGSNNTTSSAFRGRQVQLEGGTMRVMTKDGTQKDVPVRVVTSNRSARTDEAAHTESDTGQRLGGHPIKISAKELCRLAADYMLRETA